MRIIIAVILTLISSIAYGNGDELDYPGGAYGSNSQRCADIADPYEKLNRKIFTFNSILDYFLLKPVARGYRNAANEEFRGKVTNAVQNTHVPLTMVNNILQQKPRNALLSFWQFTINTIFGIGGLENVAKKTGLEVTPQTFGSTLARYGVGPGPYIVLPIFGGTSARDMLDPIVTNKYMNPLHYAMSSEAEFAVTGVKLVSDRSDILPFTEHVSETSTDPYVTIRSSVYQNREKSIAYPLYYRCRR